MRANEDFPDFLDDAAKILEWLQGYADSVASLYPSEIRDDERMFRHVLLMALGHDSREIRCEALNVLQRSLEKHDTAHIFARPIAENLIRLHGEELLISLSIIGLSCDPTLSDYLTPFLHHDDPHIRGEAFESISELEVVRKSIRS